MAVSFKDEAMIKTMLRIVRWAVLGAAVLLVGCAKGPPPYGQEQRLQSSSQQTWAVAPAINLSGQRQVDGIIQADILYEQLQQVAGLTVIPVNRVAEAYLNLGIEQVQSEEQAALVCQYLGCERLVVPTVTIYDPFDPPKLGASLQLFGSKGGERHAGEQVDLQRLARRASLPDYRPLPRQGRFVQVVGMYDAASGSVRDAVLRYAHGRSDPVGPLGAKEYLVSMDRYCGFVYHQLIRQLLQAQAAEFAGSN